MAKINHNVEGTLSKRSKPIMIQSWLCKAERNQGKEEHSACMCRTKQNVQMKKDSWEKSHKKKNHRKKTYNNS